MNKETTYPTPISLDTDTVLPKFPVEALPGFLGQQAQAVAEHTETPIELAALNGLATVAASVQGKYLVEVKPGYQETLNIYTTTVLPSGNRKTAALRLMMAPFQEWEATRARKFSNKEGQEAKGYSEDFEDIEKEIEQLPS